MTTLTNDSLLAVADRLGVQTLPLVLAVGPQQDTFDAWRAARDAAVAELTTLGVFDAYGDVEPELADALYTLAQPDAELVARSYGEADRRRICLARRGSGHASAVRTGATFEITTDSIDGSDRELARLLLAALPSCAPAEVAAVSVAADDLAARLDAAETTSQYVDAMYALGIDAHQATVLGAAFGSCRGYTEIVAQVHHDGLTTRAPGAVAGVGTPRPAQRRSRRRKAMSPTAIPAAATTRSQATGTMSNAPPGSLG
ncbi:ESX secretion-associated protein EspG, partial [Nocardia neocaledoniensis]|uniref:ESX secretion-associated protein EspG n=1 Tax=Nocardia neocaledoniensis TaxID=236511 RepID=UPI0024543238